MSTIETFVQTDDEATRKTAADTLRGMASMLQGIVWTLQNLALLLERGEPERIEAVTQSPPPRPTDNTPTGRYDPGPQHDHPPGRRYWASLSAEELASSFRGHKAIEKLVKGVLKEVLEATKESAPDTYRRTNDAPRRSNQRLSNQRFLSTNVVSVDRSEFEEHLAEALAGRSWLIEKSASRPFQLEATFRAGVSEEEIIEYCLKARDSLVFDITHFVDKPIIHEEELVFLGLYPSGSVRGLSGTIRVDKETTEFVLSEPSALVDPDSDIDRIPSSGLRCQLQVIALTAPKYGD